MSALILFSCTPSKNKNTFEIETKLGTIVNQKWSEYKYKSHFKIQEIAMLKCIQG